MPAFGLRPIEVLALSKMLKDNDKDEARSGVEPGEYDVNFIVRIVGSLRVGDDYDAHIVAKADPWMLLAVALSHLNNKTIMSIVKEAAEMVHDEDSTKSLKKEVRKALAKLKKPTLTPCSGPVTTKIDAVAIASAGKRKAKSKTGEDVEEAWENPATTKTG